MSNKALYQQMILDFAYASKAKLDAEPDISSDTKDGYMLTFLVLGMSASIEDAINDPLSLMDELNANPTYAARGIVLANHGQISILKELEALDESNGESFIVNSAKAGMSLDEAVRYRLEQDFISSNTDDCIMPIIAAHEGIPLPEHVVLGLYRHANVCLPVKSYESDVSDDNDLSPSM